MLDMAAKIREGLTPPRVSGVNPETTLHPLKLALSARSGITVAHVDHGIRSDSGDDRRFCEGLAARYGFEFASTELKLGANASEEAARNKRYEFLFAEAKKRDAVIVTAHHADDLAGTIAINLHRGTGWRGVAVLGRPGIERPLLHLRKKDIYRYAVEHHLEYSEDSTNSNLEILRNSLRGRIFALDDTTVKSLGAVRDKALTLAHAIDTELEVLDAQFFGMRHPYTQIDQSLANELLRHGIGKRVGVRPTRLEADNLLLAIKLARARKIFELSGGSKVVFSGGGFVVQSSHKW